MSSVPGSVERSSDNWISWKSLNLHLYTSYVSGATLVSGVLTYPFYVMTTRKQAGAHITGDASLSGKNISILQTIQKIGWSGLFRGVLFSNLFYIPSSTLYLSVTEISRQNINSYLHKFFPHVQIEYLDGVQVLYSGILSNFTSLLLSNPANVVLAKMVVQKCSEPAMNSLAIARTIYSTYGPRGFFLGFGSNLTHGICGSVVWWWSYTTFRRLSSAYSKSFPIDVFWTDAIAGLGAGLLSTSLLHPFDTVASRIMTGSTRHHRMVTVFRDIIAREGVRGLYTGIGPSISGSAASSCIFALTYELIKRKAVSGPEEEEASE
jgi:solute carrier family 25, member 44